MPVCDRVRQGIAAGVVMILPLVATVVSAQSPAGLAPRFAAAHGAVAQAQSRADSPGAFVLEALGGSLGSLAGIALIGLTADCGGDDLGCEILTIGAAGAVGIVGATIGTMITARYTGSRRSTAGALLGAIVGTGAGLGVHYLVNRASNRNLDQAGVVPIFVISQGTIAALGSRLLGSAPATRTD